MKQFACGDVVPGCDATFDAADEPAMLGLVASHARESHGLTEIGPDLVSQVRAAIRTT